ncbi:hypothetical protein BIFBIF_01948 [Bifidobacterium bifidum ATCC 29521 = JCM 1255 = DSM 20456]|nr:hypothetical protein BIFBIF_01948 [Bifidobacterium bifidum ATCC 29521 = JCM 1255 = DSM 20456]
MLLSLFTASDDTVCLSAPASLPEPTETIIAHFPVSARKWRCAS